MYLAWRQRVYHHPQLVTCDVCIQNEDPSLVDELDSLIYDYRVCQRCSWAAGDVTMDDKSNMLHTLYVNPLLPLTLKACINDITSNLGRIVFSV